MGWEPIPESEMPQVVEAAKSGGCVVCYKPAGPGHHLYCHEHDDGCGVECPDAAPPAFCRECNSHESVVDEFEDQEGFEEKARRVWVKYLACGHQEVTYL